MLITVELLTLKMQDIAKRHLEAVHKQHTQCSHSIVVIAMGSSGIGWDSTVACAKASLAYLNDLVISSDQVICLFLLFP